jgi:hypothetical protein
MGQGQGRGRSLVFVFAGRGRGRGRSKSRKHRSRGIIVLGRELDIGIINVDVNSIIKGCGRCRFQRNGVIWVCSSGRGRRCRGYHMRSRKAYVNAIWVCSCGRGTKRARALARIRGRGRGRNRSRRRSRGFRENQIAGFGRDRFKGTGRCCSGNKGMDRRSSTATMCQVRKGSRI